MNKRTIKSIAFNQSDPIERDLLEHAEKHSQFSAYVKRLIQRDKEGGYNALEPSNIANDNDKDAMEGFL